MSTEMFDDDIIDDQPSWITAEQAGLSEHDLADIERLLTLLDARKSLEAEIDYLTEWLAKEVADDRIKVSDDTVIKIVRQKPRPTVDLAKVFKYDNPLFLKITKPAFDRRGFDAARKLGYFAPGTPEFAYLEYKEPKPYVRVSHITENTQEEGNK